MPEGSLYLLINVDLQKHVDDYSSQPNYESIDMAMIEP